MQTLKGDLEREIRKFTEVTDQKLMQVVGEGRSVYDMVRENEKLGRENERLRREVDKWRAK